MANTGKQAMGLVIGASVALYAFVYVGVPAITELFEAETTEWSDGAAGLVTVIAVFFILAVAVLFAKPAMDRI